MRNNIDGVITKPLEIFSDDRGWLAEIFRTDELQKEHIPAMSYISITKPGKSRGPHEHKHQTDLFCFIGPGTFELSLWDNREDSKTYTHFMKIKVGLCCPCIVLIPPGVVHGYKNISDVDAMCINYPNKLFKGINKSEQIDEIRHEDDNSSRFVL